MDEGTYRRWVLIIAAVALAIALALVAVGAAHAAPLEPGPGHPGAVVGTIGAALTLGVGALLYGLAIARRGR